MADTLTAFCQADTSSEIEMMLTPFVFDLDGTAGDDTIFSTNTIDRINGKGGAANDSNYDLERKTA